MQVEILPIDERKSQVVAGLLSIFMWPLGAHCFYLRQFVGGFLNICLFCLFYLLSSQQLPINDQWNTLVNTYSIGCLAILGITSTIYGLCLLSMKVHDFNIMFNRK